MAANKKKSFFEGPGDEGSSRRSKLAKQAINSLIGGGPDNDSEPGKESTGRSGTQNADMHNAGSEISPELKAIIEKIVEDAAAKYQNSSLDAVSKLESVLYDVKEQLGSIKELEDKVGGYDERFASLEKKLEQQKEAMSKSEGIFIETASRIGSLIDKIQSGLGSVREIEEKLLSYGDRVAGLENQLEGQKDAAAKSQADSLEAVSKIESVREEIQAELQSIKELEGELANHSEKVAGLEGQIDQQKEIMSQYEANCLETAAKIESVRDEIKVGLAPIEEIEDKLIAHCQRFARLEEQVEGQKDAFAKREEEKAVCECCERTDLAVGEMVKIDSGQLLCHDCLIEMRQMAEG